MTFSRRGTCITEGIVGRVVVASPYVQDPFFNRSVVLICDHSARGAVGFIINKPFLDLTVAKFLTQINVPPISLDSQVCEQQVNHGGLISSERGFVLHSNDYNVYSTITINESTSVTSTTEILRDIAVNEGPKNFLISLGYTGWYPGQLEYELYRSNWFLPDIDSEFVFDTNTEVQWKKALNCLGIESLNLSSEAGHS